MEEPTKHRPVLVNEVVELLSSAPTKMILDGTFGGGGHSRALLEAGANVIAVDRDPAVSQFAELLKQEFGKKFRFENLPYDDVEKLNVKFDGALLDLGLSSDQLESLGRGFSFQHTNDPLDLRFDSRSGQTAAQFLSQASLNRIEATFRDLAEDRYWRRLSSKIVATRRAKPIRTVSDFVVAIGSTDPKVLAPLFQALRVVVNDELNHLKIGLEAIAAVLKPGAVLAVISFHSLEDRIVKEFLKNGSFELKTKKPIIPTVAEIESNPRSRSAKLRAGVKK
ncbi:MAG TPA: 16S rRNA (cytosine(1402)-N(4))-methyltransferase RsmH [Candidatus Saccharimonadales bacterium]|nr:16S rRNA (cytosine(1402)-N(4))-methyltransferase RsmH [Candidatus Saccharimonadales bacterium]